MDEPEPPAPGDWVWSICAEGNAPLEVDGRPFTGDPFNGDGIIFNEGDPAT